MSKYDIHLGTALAGHTSLDIAAVLDLARSVATRHGMQSTRATTNRQTFEVTRGRRAIAAFEVREIVPPDSTPEGNIAIDGSWTEATIVALGSSNTKLARAMIAGFPGYAAYRTFLDDLANEISSADASSRVAVRVDA